MGAKILQPTFTGGELSPSLYARVDLVRYGTSLRTAKNFLVRAYGGVVNRPGFEFCGEAKDSTKRVRLIPFEFSTEVAYVIEMGDLYMRFIYQGDYVLAEALDGAYSGATTYGLGDLVSSGGIVYKSLQAGNLNNTPASSPTWWQPNPLSEIATPWTEAQLREVAFTQSADVLYLTHPSYQPIEVRRLTANTFEARLFANKNGPFAAINSDESIKVSVSAETGNVTITSSKDIFTADMVDALFYVEEKDLRGQRPWEPGWRNPTIGTLCRSDGKVYRCSAVPSTPMGGWIQTGGIRPVHDSGKAYDGPADTRDLSGTQYAVGIEWEYMHSGFGAVLITGFTNGSTVTGVVTLRIPKSCVGGLGSPGSTWNLVGDGATKTFAIAGAVSESESDYYVSIDGIPVQSNPYYQPPSGIGGGAGPGGGDGGNTYIP